MKGTGLTSHQRTDFTLRTLDLLRAEPSISAAQAGQRVAKAIAEEAGQPLGALFPGQTINELVKDWDHTFFRDYIETLGKNGQPTLDEVRAALQRLFTSFDYASDAAARLRLVAPYSTNGAARDAVAPNSHVKGRGT